MSFRVSIFNYTLLVTIQQNALIIVRDHIIWIQWFQPEEFKERHGCRMCCLHLCYKFKNGKFRTVRKWSFAFLCILWVRLAFADIIKEPQLQSERLIGSQYSRVARLCSILINDITSIRINGIKVLQQQEDLSYFNTKSFESCLIQILINGECMSLQYWIFLYINKL